MTSRSDPPEHEESEPEGPDEERMFLLSLKEDLCQMLEDCQHAMAERFDKEMTDFDEGNELWSLLPSHVRTAIKRGRSKTPQICTQCGGMGTHTRNCISGGRFS